MLEAFSAAIAASEADERAWLYNVLLLAIAAHRVGNRPKRIEPRRLKRRYDRYPFLTVPREQAREVMLNGQTNAPAPSITGRLRSIVEQTNQPTLSPSLTLELRTKDANHTRNNPRQQQASLFRMRSYRLVRFTLA